MTPDQRQAALRLADALDAELPYANGISTRSSAAALLRELAGETDDTALLFRALNALVYYRQQTRPIEVTDRVIDALHKRLAAEPVQEPVAWYLPQDGYDSFFRDHSTVVACTGNKWEGWLPLYAAPQQRKPLTHQQLLTWWNATTGSPQERVIQYGQFIERSHGIGGSDE